MNILSYSHSRIDRAGNLRKDEVWLAKQQNSHQARIIPYWRNQNLVLSSGISFQSITIEKSEHIFLMASEIIFLGLESERPIFAVDLSGYEEDKVLELAGSGEFHDLRKIATLLDHEEASLLAYGRGLMNWHKTHAYCSHCGSKSMSTEGGHSRKCTNATCNALCFPRLDPAIITLIEHIPAKGEPLCLLAVHDTPVGKICSTLAGFVEPGESLEGAVQREMMEEAGLLVKNIEYVASQPWPFPASIMIGFKAESDTLDFKLDKDEIQNAAWFSAKELMTARETGEMRLSKEDSIARFLIEDWITKNFR